MASLWQIIIPVFVRNAGDPMAAKEIAVQSLSALLDQEALSLAFIDGFLLYAMVGGALAGLVLLMNRSIIEKTAAPPE